MIVADTSVVIAALSPWHDHHDEAQRALARRVTAVAHVIAESYSVLTRLPEPFRMTPAEAADGLRQRFTSVIGLPDSVAQSLPGQLAAAGVSGGSVYDAVVGLTAASHDAELLTLDARAVRTYVACRARHRLLGIGAR